MAAYHTERVRGKGEFSDNRECDYGPADLLATLFNLSRTYSSLFEVAMYPVSTVWSKDDWEVFNTRPFFPDAEAEFDQWLRDRLEDTAIQEQTLTSILKGLGILGDTKPHKPCWVTWWGRFKPYLSNGNDWWRIVGQMPPREGEWLLLLAYPMDHAKPLRMPTQLDAGWHGLHFPSPPDADHGCAMEVCGGATGAGHIVEEYVHGAIKLDVDYWVNADRVAPFRVPGRRDLTAGIHLEDRRRHWDKLRANYPSTAAWMADPLNYP
jgi:hypothetical protein